MEVGNERAHGSSVGLAPVEHASPAPFRITSGHIPALDGIRGAAAATVFIYHYGGGARSSDFAFHIVGKTIHLGWVGVSLFFVLSGFLITGILLDSMQRPNWRVTFYIRRALRIFPLYYFALLGAILVALLLNRPWSSISPLWPLFFYLQDIPQIVRTWPLSPLFVVGHFWSLAVEEQFYLVWPFLLLFASRRNALRPLCMGVYLFSLLFRICIFGLHLNTEWATYFIIGRAGEMAAGGFLAASIRGSERERGQITRGAKPLLLTSLAGVTAIVWFTKETAAAEPWLATLGIALFTLIFTALISLCLKPGITERVFKFPTLRWLGKISYGIYVYHLLLAPLYAWLTRQVFPGVTGRRYLLALAAVATVCTLLAASVSFATLESRFLRLKDSLGKPRPVPASDGLSTAP
jgi:peptidoglycan/LPS O-acetylase OafA/YrhL